MFGFLRGAFGGAGNAPPELALRLADYVEDLVALGGLGPHVDAYLADPEGFSPPGGATAKALSELPLEAQMYVSCFIVQSFMESGSTDSKEAAAVMNHVLEAAGGCTQDQAAIIASLGMRLRGILGQDPAQDDEWEQNLRAYGHIGEAAVATARAFMARIGAGDHKPTPAEIEHFLVTYVKEDERAAELRRLAEHLAGYAQRLSAAAIMMPNVGAALADPDDLTAEKLVGKGHFDWTIEAQVFLMSLILEACVGQGFEEDEQILQVVGWVIGEGLKNPGANVQSMTATAAQLRHLVLSGDDGEDQGEDARRLIPIAAHGIERGKAVAARLAAGDDEPATEELEDFVARFGGGE